MVSKRPQTTICEVCGKTIQVMARGAVPRYCSQACSQRASSARRKAQRESGRGDPYVCRFCGKTFCWFPSKTNSALPLYCSDTCKTMASRSHHQADYDDYQQRYYQDHAEEILSKKRDGPPRVKLTPEERKARIREYNTAYKREWRKRKKMIGTDEKPDETRLPS